MQKRQFLATAASLTALSSTPWLAGCASRRSRTAVRPAEMIFYGGPILTMNDAQPQVEAMAVHAGRIVALGRWGAVTRWPAGRAPPRRWWTCRGAP